VKKKRGSSHNLTLEKSATPNISIDLTRIGIRDTPAGSPEDLLTSIPDRSQAIGFFLAIFCREKWPELELNQRHKDFQSSALPTELSGQKEDE
jgi:hypothetical protein